MCHHLREAFPGHAKVAFTSRSASHPPAQCLHMAYPSHLFKFLSPSLRQEPQELCSLLPPNIYHSALSSARAVETLVHGMNAQRACLGPLQLCPPHGVKSPQGQRVHRAHHLPSRLHWGYPETVYSLVTWR